MDSYKKALEMLKSGQNQKFAEGIASQIGDAVGEGLAPAMPTMGSEAPKELLSKFRTDMSGSTEPKMMGRKIEIEFGTPNVEMPAMELDMSPSYGDPAKDAAKRLREALSSGSFADLASSKNFGKY